MEPRYYDDVRPYIWKKVTSNSANNTAFAVLRIKIKEVVAVLNRRELTHGVFREAANVAETMGILGILFEKDCPFHLLKRAPHTTIGYGVFDLECISGWRRIVHE